MSNIILINNQTVPKIISYDVSFEKLWSSDTGRSMTGENKGTLIGIFPKITLKLGKMSKAEASEILKLVNKPNATVKYFDPEYKCMCQGSFYFGNAKDTISKYLDKGKTVNVIGDISIIANSRRTADWKVQSDV